MKKYISKIMCLLIVGSLAVSTVTMPNNKLAQEIKRIKEQTAQFNKTVQNIASRTQKEVHEMNKRNKILLSQMNNAVNSNGSQNKKKKLNNPTAQSSSMINSIKVSVVAGIGIGLYYLYKWYNR